MSDDVQPPPFPPGSEVFVRFAGAGSEAFRQYVTEGAFRSEHVRWHGASFIHGTVADCRRDAGAGLVTRATFTGRSRPSRDGGTVWEFHPIEPVDVPRSALVASRADSPTGHDRAPDRYTTQGRETIDRQHDLAGRFFEEAIGAGLDVGDAAFYVHCCLCALKYEDRTGKKGPDDPVKAAWYRKMAAHLMGAGEDPRAVRPGFVAYRRQA